MRRRRLSTSKQTPTGPFASNPPGVRFGFRADRLAWAFPRATHHRTQADTMKPWCVAMGALFPNVAGAWDEPLRGTEACGSTTGRSGRSCGVPRERVNLMPRQPPRPVSRINPPEAAPGPISRRPLDSAFSLRTDNSPTLKASAPTRRQEAAQSGGDERGSTSSRRAIHGRDAGLCT